MTIASFGRGVQKMTTKQEDCQRAIEKYLELGPEPAYYHEEEREVWQRLTRFIRGCVSIWVKSQPPLPERGGVEDRVARKLLEETYGLEFLLKWINVHLVEISGYEEPFDFENRISSHKWARICTLSFVSSGSRDIVSYMKARLASDSTEIFLRVWEGCLEPSLFPNRRGKNRYRIDQGERDAIERAKPLVREFADDHVLRLLLKMPEDSRVYESNYVELLYQHFFSGDSHPQLTPEWRNWFRIWVRHFPTSKIGFRTFDLLSLILDEELAVILLEQRGIDFLTSLKKECGDLARKLVHLAPDRIAQIIANSWGAFNKWEEDSYYLSSNVQNALSVLSLADETFVGRFACDLGYEIGRYAEKTGLDPQYPQLIESYFEKMKFSEVIQLPEETRLQAILWTILRKVARYKSRLWESRTELIGVEALLSDFVSKHPEEWARALPYLLAHMKHFEGTIEAITISLYHKSEDVRKALARCIALDSALEVRDRARGILNLSLGVTGLEEGMAHDIISFVARQLDGTPAFPHPLEVRSSIWIGSLHVENILRQCVQQAEYQFQRYFDYQGAVVEEGPTAVLLNELEVAFRNRQLTVQGLGYTNTTTQPSVSFSQMQITKEAESTYGCDISFILKGQVHGACDIESAELVQVKKPEMVRTDHQIERYFRHAWRISVSQLQHIINFSQTATYWLIQPNGQVFAVPARLLYAIIKGAEKLHQSTVTISYDQVRSQAITLAQFLVDLFIGVWLGTSREDVLRFARGEDLRTKPRYVVKIRVQFGKYE